MPKVPSVTSGGTSRARITKKPSSMFSASDSPPRYTTTGHAQLPRARPPTAAATFQDQLPGGAGEIPDHRAVFHVFTGLVGDSETVVPYLGGRRPAVDWLKLSGPDVAAPSASRAPWPSTKGLPTGPGLVLASRRALTWLGLRPGLAASTSAAAPLVIAALNDVPEPTKFAVPVL